jgi:hypothetical protein
MQLLHQRLVLENISHYLVFHRSGGMPTGMNTDSTAVYTANMTTKMTT